MAAAASGCDAEFCLSHLPAALTLQYQAVWLEMQGNVTAALDIRLGGEELL